MKTILAWHFTRGMKLRDGDPLVVGKTYRHKGPVVLCQQGYHGSIRLTDALKYAPGAQLSQVALWGDVQKDNTKIVARNRKVLWTMNTTRVLHLFSCQVAENALKKVANPDPRSLAAIETKRQWLRGEATIGELAATRAAAWDAAVTAWDAPWTATRGVEWAAARAAARATTPDAVWSASKAAEAIGDSAEELLVQMITDASPCGKKEAPHVQN